MTGGQQSVLSWRNEKIVDSRSSERFPWCFDKVQVE